MDVSHAAAAATTTITTNPFSIHPQEELEE